MIMKPTYMKLREGLRFVAGPKRSALYEMATGRVFSVDPLTTRILVMGLKNVPVGEIPGRLWPEGEGPERRHFELFLRHPFIRLTSEPDRPGPPPVAPAPHRLEFLWIELTATCNLRCQHCYASSSPDRLPGAMTGGDYLRLIREAAVAGCRTVQFTGGEIFLRKDLAGLVRESRARGIANIELYTNASLIRDRDLDLLQELGVSFAVSVYSHRPESHDAITLVPGSWKRTIAAIGRILERKIPIRIGVVRMKENWNDMEGTRKFLAGMGIADSRIRVDTVRPAGRGCEGSLGDPDPTLIKLGPPTRFEPEENRLSARTCWNGKLAVDPEGNVYPCVFSRNLPVGNVKRQSLAEVMAGDSLRDLWSITLEKVVDCRECEFRYACFDCRLQAYARTGNLLAKPPTCSYRPGDGTVEQAEGMPIGASRLVLKAVPSPRQGVILRRMEGENVLWDRESQAMHVLNPTAARIWEWCDGETTREEIIDKMCDRFAATRERVAEDVGKTLASFQELGLMQ